jgi:hypothetical protein
MRNTDLWLCVLIAIAIIATWLYRKAIGAAPLFDPIADAPPISDEEFLSRCKPGTDPAVALRVREIVADQLAIRRETIYPEHRFVEDLKAD